MDRDRRDRCNQRALDLDSVPHPLAERQACHIQYVLENRNRRSHFVLMTDDTPRRTPSHKVRRTISEILERIDAIEYSVGLYEHKSNHADLGRARENFLTLRRHVDRLGDTIATLDEPATADDRVVEPAV